MNKVGRWKTYPAYRDAGIELLDKLPEHWEIVPLKRLGEFQAGAGFPEIEQGVLSEGIPFFKVGDMSAPSNEVYMNVFSHTVSLETAKRLRASVLAPNTIVFAKVGAALLLNRRRILTRPSCIDNNIMGFFPQHCDLNWAFYWLSGLDLGELANPGAVPSVSEGQLRNVSVIVPPLPEQRAIADFLDRETARIDALIAKKQRLIELLQEKRTALISHAVTKGLDAGVAMKESGVAWLGEVPAHWMITRGKWLFTVRTERARPDDIQLSATQAYGVISQEEFMRKEGRRVTQITQHLEKRNHVEIDDFVISMRSFQGGLERSWETGCIRSSYVVLRPAPQINVDFFMYLFKSSLYIQALRATSNFLRDGQDMNFGNFTLVDLPLIPQSEQKTIAAFLDKEIQRIDQLVEKSSQFIDLLQEYRTALISAVVTGKIDVRLQ